MMAGRLVNFRTAGPSSWAGQGHVPAARLNSAREAGTFGLLNQIEQFLSSVHERCI
jgi:hypothetical protein